MFDIREGVIRTGGAEVICSACHKPVPRGENREQQIGITLTFSEHYQKLNGLTQSRYDICVRCWLKSLGVENP